ncbi:MAG: DUF3710 domain-containing protein [Pseudonocardia sp.]|nr:DUF3710 domain-containing protein [Pseudonocardia sp.]
MSERAYDEFDLAARWPGAPIRRLSGVALADSELDVEGLGESRELNFGPLRVWVPVGMQLRMANENGPISDAVFFTVPPGQVRLSVLAAPRSGRLWPDLAEEIASSQARLGAEVSSTWGEWGREVRIASDGELNWVIGIDGPRWMLLGRATWPDDASVGLVEPMREIMRACVVIRGDEPLPVRAALPLTPPDLLESQIEDTGQQNGRGTYADVVQLIPTVTRPPRSSSGDDEANQYVYAADLSTATMAPITLVKRGAGASGGGSVSDRMRSRTAPLMAAGAVVSVLGIAGVWLARGEHAAPIATPKVELSPSAVTRQVAAPPDIRAKPKAEGPKTTPKVVSPVPVTSAMAEGAPGTGPKAAETAPTSASAKSNAPAAGSAKAPVTAAKALREVSAPKPAGGSQTAVSTKPSVAASASGTQRTTDTNSVARDGGGHEQSRQASMQDHRNEDRQRSERRNDSQQRSERSGLLDELSDGVGGLVSGLG